MISSFARIICIFIFTATAIAYCQEKTTYDGKELLASWQMRGTGLDKSLPFPDMTTFPGSGISCDKLNWNAKDIKAVEVKFRAFDEGGYMQLDFTTDENGQKRSSFQTMSSLADGKWHTLYFPVSEDPAWRGTVKSIIFTWRNLGTARISFEKVRAMTEKNLVPDAAEYPEKCSFKIPLIRPRGTYKLFWKGKTPAPMNLSIYDSNCKEILNKESSSSPEFKAPEMTVTANLTVKEGGEGYPVLELVELPNLDLPAAWWRGKWIWNSVGMNKPNTNVWFKREFDLSGDPVESSMVVSADDNCTIYLNGKEFKGSCGWDQPERFNIAKALRKGHNELIIKVFNAQAWGGLITDLYAKTSDGQDIFISTDENWTCHEGGDKIPPKFNEQVLVLGRPPVAPWGTRLGYSYVGPLGEIEILKAGQNGFTAKVIKPPAVTTDKIALKIVRADSSAKFLDSKIEPATDKWKAGGTVDVKLNIPPDFAGNIQKAKVFIDTDFLSVKGNVPVSEYETQKAVCQKLSQASVSGTGSRAYIEVNGEKLAPIYVDMPGSVIRQNPRRCAHHFRNALEGGSRMTRISIDLCDIWKNPDVMDFTILDNAMDVMEQNAPGLYALMVLKCGMPDWWIKDNPDEAVAYYGNQPRHKEKDRQSLASKKWLTDVRPAIKKIVEHIRQSNYASKFIGITLAEGWNSEWFWSYSDADSKPAFAGFSKAAIRAYRDYLRSKYHSDEALAKAWNRPGLRFSSIMPPRPKRIDEGSTGQLLDPEKDRDIIDYFEFRNTVIADAIEFLCKAVKEDSEGHWLTGAYYGYLIAFSTINNRLQHVGHMAIDRIARSPFIDFVIGPSFYTWRRMGMADSPMQPADTFSCHGKLVIVEQDLRNFGEDSHYEARNGKVNSVEESIGAQDRAFGMLLTRGIGTHWMEMYENWFREKVIINLIKSQMELYNSLPEKPSGTTPAEVCFISDTRSTFYVKNNTQDGIHQLLTADLFRRVNEAGFAFRHLLLSDILEEGLVPPHKLYIVTNLLVLDANQRKALMERFKKEKASVIWLYATGVFYPDRGPSKENISELLGLHFEEIVTPENLRMTAVEDLKGMPLNNSGAVKTSPWFLPVSGFDKVIGTTASGKPAMVSFKRDSATHYFAAVPNLSPEILRHIAKTSGVWIFGESGDPLHVGNDFVVLHAKTSGKKLLCIPENMVLKGVFGPFRKELLTGDGFNAEAGRTYGFQVLMK